MSEPSARHEIWVPSGGAPSCTAWIASGSVVIGHADVDLGAVVVRVSGPAATRPEWIATAQAMHDAPDAWQRAAVPIEALTPSDQSGPKGSP